MHEKRTFSLSSLPMLPRFSETRPNKGIVHTNKKRVVRIIAMCTTLLCVYIKVSLLLLARQG